MRNIDDKEHIRWILSALSLALIVGCWVIFYFGRLAYLSSEFFELKEHISRPEDANLVIYLFAAPLIIQTLGMIFLFFKLRSEPDLLGFYIFYWITMLVCLLSYLYFWKQYAEGNNDDSNSTLASLCIFVLVVLIVIMTYSIMWHSTSHKTEQGLIDRALSRIIQRWEWFVDLLNKGVAKAPFGALAFFFTVFLGITYLFSFVFAFHDKSVSSKNETPALYMSAVSSSERRTNNADSKLKGRSLIKASLRPKLKFYYELGSASLEYKISQFYRCDYANHETDRMNKEWRQRRNLENLDEIVKALMEDTTNGRIIQVKIQGRADDKRFNAQIPYSSNYDLSEARAQNLKSVIMEALSYKDNIQRNIEWACLPLSEETIQYPLSELERENLMGMAMAGDNLAEADSIRIRQAREEELIRQEQQDLESKLFGTDKDELESILKLVEGFTYRTQVNYKSQKELESDIQKRVIREKQNRGKNRLNDKSFKDQLDQIAEPAKDLKKTNAKNQERDEKTLEDKLQSLVQRLPFKAKQILVELVAHKKKLAREKQYTQEESEFIQDRDKDALKRVAEVTVIPVYNIPEFIPLSLLDYIYFTVYTITTTGYGDIIPTTAYAKFITCITNIIEVFFLVVFFNALLSIRRVRDEGLSELIETNNSQDTTRTTPNPLRRRRPRDTLLD